MEENFFSSCILHKSFLMIETLEWFVFLIINLFFSVLFFFISSHLKCRNNNKWMENWLVFLETTNQPTNQTNKQPTDRPTDRQTDQQSLSLNIDLWFFDQWTTTQQCVELIVTKTRKQHKVEQKKIAIKILTKNKKKLMMMIIQFNQWMPVDHFISMFIHWRLVMLNVHFFQIKNSNK